MLPVERVIGEEGLSATPTGLRLAMRLPWYRSLPFSTVEIASLAIDDAPVDLAAARVEYEGQSWTLAEMAEQTNAFWFVRDSAFLLLPGRTAGCGQRAPRCADHQRQPALHSRHEARQPADRHLARQLSDRRAMMTIATGPQMGVTLYSFTNEWLTRQYDLDGLLREVARRKLGPNIEIIGFQNFKEFPDVSDDFAAQFKDLIAENRAQSGLACDQFGPLPEARPAADRRCQAGRIPQAPAALGQEDGLLAGALPVRAAG